MTSPGLDGSRLDLSIVIVSWNTRDLLRSCLASILAHRGELRLETAVVDNASRDGSPEMVAREFPQVRLLRNTANLGFARANNQAVAEAVGRYILLLNPDTEVLPDALERMVAFLDAHPKAGAVACRLLNTDGTLQFSLRRFPTLMTPFTENPTLHDLPAIRRFADRARLKHWSHREISQVEQPMGAALMVRRGVLETLGLFDEVYHMFFEDVELCYRIKRNGWRIYYLPKAEIVHHGGQSVGQSREAGEHFYKSLLLYYRRTKGPWQAAMVRGSMILGSLASIAIGLGLLPSRSRPAGEILRASAKVLHFGLTLRLASGGP